MLPRATSTAILIIPSLFPRLVPDYLPRFPPLTVDNIPQVLLYHDRSPLGRRPPFIGDIGSRSGHLRELWRPYQLVCMRMSSRFRRRDMFCARLRRQHIPRWPTPACIRRECILTWERLYVFMRMPHGMVRDWVQCMPGPDGVPECVQRSRWQQQRHHQLAAEWSKQHRDV